MRASTPEIPIVELRGVTKTYREGDTTRAVLVGVDATIRRGELCVLIGRSGSGKSTLLNLIGGIDVPTSGEIVVDGTDLARSSEGARTMFRRHHVGFVFQFFNLIPTLTVEENLRLPLELNGRPTRRRARAGARRSSPRWGSATGGPLSPSTCPAASSSEWRSHAPWSTSRSWCWRTSRRVTSTSTRAVRCWICSTA